MTIWHLGTIGYSYKDWQGEFYPPGTNPRNYLPYYSRVFNSVEINTTFHSIPHKSSAQSWFEATPAEFKFCVKTPAAITHQHGLSNSQGLMNEFLESILPLDSKLGPILIQLPPRFTQAQILILREFLESLPPTYRYAIEFRHPSWYNEQTSNLLKKHGICWVTIDFPRIPKRITPTTDFLYFRWIGVNSTYQYHSFERVDRSHELNNWLAEIDPYLRDISEIFGFFNNDYAGFAAGTCLRFKKLIGLTDENPTIPNQERLF